MARWVIGLDEVGRGALAGPVVVAAALVPKNFQFSISHFLDTLRDSKKLSARQRERWYAYFAAHPKISFAVARVYPRQIEKRNISGAANLAAARAYKKLVARKQAWGNRTPAGGQKLFPPHEIFLDGGLFLGSKMRQNKMEQGNAKRRDAGYVGVKTIVKADEKIPAVAIASIIAKVHRDRFMVKLAKQYPEYGFEVHKGYGTKSHREALVKMGISEIHRRSFIKFL